MAKLKIGDIVRIPTDKGTTFAQYTHKHKRYGALLRVFEGFYDEPFKDHQELLKNRVLFSTFFPLQAAVKQNIFDIVSNQPVLNELQEFPVFRAGVVDPTTGKVGTWWLWDGENEWKIGTLSEDQKKFPIRGVWNDTLLIERIEAGWTPEADPTT